MHYLLLIYQDEAVLAQWSEEERAAEYQEYFTFNVDSAKRGVSNGAALMPTNTATTVRVRDGKILTTDGPFAETKEQLGGYFILHCNDLDEAIEIAAQIPGAKHGSIEIRPVMEVEGML
jgi:hypothetical protein